MSAAQLKPLRCDMCGSSENVATFHSPREDGIPFAEELCPACAQRTALIYASERDLYAVLWPAVQAWAQRWTACGLTPQTLEGSLEVLGAYMHPHGAAHRPKGAKDAIAAALRGDI